MLSVWESLRTTALNDDVGPNAKIQGSCVFCIFSDPVLQRRQFRQLPLNTIILFVTAVPGSVSTSMSGEKTGSVCPSHNRGLSVTPTSTSAIV
jgi:hypothetical protein